MISVTLAVMLAMLGVALLVYFIAHLVNLVQSSTIVNSAHHDAIKTIAGLENLDKPPTEARALEDRPEVAVLLAGDPLVIRARESGYVQYLTVEAAVDAVTSETEGEKTVVVEIPFGPGRFVAAGLPMVRVCPWVSSGSRLKKRYVVLSTSGRSARFARTSPLVSGSFRI